MQEISGAGGVGGRNSFRSISLKTATIVVVGVSRRGQFLLSTL